MPDLETILAKMRARAPDMRGLGYRVRIELTDLGESVVVDGIGSEVLIEPGDGDADTVLKLSSTDMSKLVKGQLSPMLAFATGKLRVEGSKGVALKLASMLDVD